MSLHASQPAPGLPRRPQSQHHLAPLLDAPLSRAPPQRPQRPQRPRPPSRAPPRDLSSPRNRCSVGVGVASGSAGAGAFGAFGGFGGFGGFGTGGAFGSALGAGAGASGAEGNPRADAVRYALAHELPRVLNEMMRDLLRERPEDVDGWMLRWFEEAVERRRRQWTRLQREGALSRNSSEETLVVQSPAHMKASKMSLSASIAQTSHESLDCVSASMPQNISALAQSLPTHSTDRRQRRHSQQVRRTQQFLTQKPLVPTNTQRPLAPSPSSPLRERVLHSAEDDNLIIVHQPYSTDVLYRPRFPRIAELHIQESSGADPV